MVRQTSFHSKAVWHFEYKIELLISSADTNAPDERVTCLYENECVFVYSYGYTPVINYLSNGAAIAGQVQEFQIIRNNALDVVRDNMALKEIKIEKQNCDYTDRINESSSTSKYGIRQYGCALQATDFQTDATFQYQDHVGKAIILPQAKFFDIDQKEHEQVVLPAITSLSSTSGQAGLTMTIRGTSFVTDATKFYVGTQECTLQGQPAYQASTKDYLATCIVPAANQADASTLFHKNGHGFRQAGWYDVSSILEAQLVETQRAPDFENKLLLNAEHPYNNEAFKNKKVISRYDTWFCYGETTLVRFWVTASKDVRIYMNPMRPNEILDRNTEMSLILENK